MLQAAAAYNSLVPWGPIESCRLAPVQDGQAGVILQYTHQDSLLSFERYYNNHLDVRDKIYSTGDPCPFDNLGEVALYNVDTLDKWEDLLRQWNEIGRVDSSSRDLGEKFESQSVQTRTAF